MRSTAVLDIEELQMQFSTHDISQIFDLGEMNHGTKNLQFLVELKKLESSILSPPFPDLKKSPKKIA